MAENRVKLAGVRKIIGDRMLHSVNTIPQVWGNIKVDMTEFLAMTDRMREKGKKISSTSILIKALAIALRETPELNARLEQDEIVYYDHINPGVAVNSETGLLVLTLKQVEDKTLTEIEAEFRELIAKLRAKKLTMDDMTGGTVTLSNLMKEKLNAFNSIINNEECLIIGVGGVQRVPAVLPDGGIVPRDISTLTANMNHTIVDGMSSAIFLGRMQELLQNPVELLLNDSERGELL